MSVKMWAYFYFIFVYINFVKSLSVNSIPSSSSKNDVWRLDCQNGTLLAASVCLPEGYLKEEIPEIPTVVNTRIEINNIREVNEKKMRITLDFYQELIWVDNRIKTRLSTNAVSVTNNNVINSIWKPDLWIKNLFDFKLHSVFEPTSGLIIMNKEYCESMNCTKREAKLNTFVTYNFEAQATINCNFHFLNYPMDTQYCEFIMDGAYPYPNIVNFLFDLGLFGVTNENSNIDDFEIDVIFNEQNNQTGIHSIINLERCIFPFIIKYYLPCIAIITTSSVSFLLSLEHIPVRVTILVTNFLTLTNILMAQQVNIQNLVPE